MPRNYLMLSGLALLVTAIAAGDVVEIEETVGADAVPPAILEAAQKTAGKDAKFRLEKKTMVLYEVEFKKSEKRHVLVLTPDGRETEREEQGVDED